MEDNNKLDIYIKGFEHGYWLKRGNSEELDAIIERSNHDTYKAGLQAGKKEAIRESVRDRLQSNDQKREKGMDMD